MSYLLQRNQRSHSPLLWTLCILAAVLLIVFIKPQILENASRALGLPFLRMRAATSDATSIFGDAWAGKEQLAKENRELRDKLEEMQLKASLYDETRAEYNDLLAFGDGSESTTYARVLATPRTAGYDVMLIDIGSGSVAKGDIVVGHDMVLLGRVESLGESSARVVLFSSPELETPVVFPKTGVDAVAKGEGGGAFLLEVPQDTVIEKGDAIALRSVPGKAIAFVAEVSLDPTDAFKTIHAAVPVNIFDIRHVGILH